MLDVYIREFGNLTLIIGAKHGLSNRFMKLCLPHQDGEGAGELWVVAPPEGDVRSLRNTPFRSRDLFASLAKHILP